MKNLLIAAALLVGSSALADQHDKKADKKMAKAAAGHVDCSKVKPEDQAACKAKMNPEHTEAAPAAAAPAPTGH